MRRLFPRSFLPATVLSAIVGGGILAGSWLFPLPAEALSDEDIVDKLEQVPVFIILNSDGQPLTASAEANNQEVKVPVVFIDGETAETFLDQAQAEDQSATIALIDLGTLYQETHLSAEAATPLLYFPIVEELDTAMGMEEDFQGVPLFIARQGEDGPYLTITQNGETSLPMFFSRNDLQTLLDRYAETDAAAAQEIVVQVLSLEWLLATMATNEDPALDAQLEQVRLFPSTEVLNYIRSQQPESGQ
ncbi:Tic22 family protein [Nodosilinea sp. P-1105]|uniref:Tic22 family protein n=1 Tax=Nodosilinea sp. P-1105 TaxID=2546229 RepID=UPI00146A522B|nr:Tic22 family protein [Nodosilinea sp. P-1105]NMF82896.1 hypothetical protein [Nodosilinea sp. P-1105]